SSPAAFAAAWFTSRVIRRRSRATCPRFSPRDSGSGGPASTTSSPSRTAWRPSSPSSARRDPAGPRRGRGAGSSGRDPAGRRNLRRRGVGRRNRGGGGPRRGLGGEPGRARRDGPAHGGVPPRLRGVLARRGVSLGPAPHRGAGRGGATGRLRRRSGVRDRPTGRGPLGLLERSASAPPHGPPRGGA